MPGIEAIGEGARILLVEDDAVVCELLSRKLRERGFLVEVSASVEHAREVAGAWKPQAAILDLVLGRASGLELIPELVAAHPGIRVVVLTGYASIATAVHAIKMGAGEYLAKPASVEDIVAALRGDRSTAAQASLSDIPSIRRLEWEHIQRVLAEHAGNISETARVLGVTRRTLQRKLAKRPVRK